jgi:hypothetical protein
MTKEFDTEFQEHKIERVNKESLGYACQMDTGFVCYVIDVGIEPHVGDTIRLYGQPFGFVRGIDINGQQVRYETAEEMQLRHEREQAEKDAKAQDAYGASLSANNERVAKLPAEFQQRINDFRSRRDYWGWKFEGYELFVCEQAVAIAKHVKAEDLHAFHNLPWEKQKLIVPELEDGHSGNTFGSACSLAKLYLENPQLVPKQHGALCPLVGCDDYGCYSTVAEIANK